MDLLVVLDQPEPAWLRRCLRSIVSQTHPHWTLALVASTPISARVLEALGEELNGVAPIRVSRVDLDGSSPAAATGEALAASDAPLVALIDPHDELAVDALALLVTRLGDAVCSTATRTRSTTSGCPRRPVQAGLVP